MSREQYRPITNDNSLSNNQIFETVTRISESNIDTDPIKLICSLDPNEAHGCDGISKRMLTFCATSIPKALHILFNNIVMNECFPNEWVKVNIIPVHIKGEKKIIKKLPTCVTRPYL